MGYFQQWYFTKAIYLLVGITAFDQINRSGSDHNATNAMHIGATSINSEPISSLQQQQQEEAHNYVHENSVHFHRGASNFGSAEFRRVGGVDDGGLGEDRANLVAPPPLPQAIPKENAPSFVLLNRRRQTSAVSPSANKRKKKDSRQPLNAEEEEEEDDSPKEEEETAVAAQPDEDYKQMPSE